MITRYERRIEAYPREAGAQFTPKAPTVPEGMRARWSLSTIRPLEPGWLMCTWELREDMTVHEELRNVRATIVAVYDMLRQLHPAESDHPTCHEVEGVIARTLVKLGTMRKRQVPQHLEKYVEDMEIEW